jgi:integrase
MMNLAEVWRMRPNGSNPCRHIKKYRENKRERYLSEAELARLGEALTEVDQDGTVMPSAVAAIRLLIFTGARLSEILTLRWDYVEHSYLRLPDSKTGAKVIYLNPPASELLARLPRIVDNPYVIPGNKPGARLVNLQKPWRLIRARAGLEDVRIHDLRHTFASIGAASGLSLPMIGKLLGHTQAATTERYAHLADDPVRAASEAIGQRIDAAMKGEATGADVVQGRGTHGN